MLIVAVYPNSATVFAGGSALLFSHPVPMFEHVIGDIFPHITVIICLKNSFFKWGIYSILVDIAVCQYMLVNCHAVNTEQDYIEE